MENIGRYTVLRKIGSGGMAEVFLTLALGAQGTEKVLVTKKIHPTLACNTQFIDMFIDEARVAMRLNHSNIVQVYNFEQIDDAFILAMEYVDGFDLLELRNLARSSKVRMPFGLAAFIAAEAAKGLDYAHSRMDDLGEPLEIVHRDVSPQNILISREGAVKVTDFGIARARSLQQESTNSVKGKFGYMAPEQAAAKPVDRRTDIYALGVVLHELLTGKALVKFKPGDDHLGVVMNAVHPSALEIDPLIPTPLDAIVQKAMAREPGDRYVTARKMASDLTRYLHSEPDIHDAQALESWIGDVAPASVPALPSQEEEAATIAIGRGAKPGRALGQVEQRVAIQVRGFYEISPHPSRIEVVAELGRLIDDMTYKAGGVLRQQQSGFSTYLGIPQSSVEDAILGIRFAGDILEATGALSRDHNLKISIKLSINRGLVRCPLSAGNNLEFDPDAALSEQSTAFLDMARYGEIVADDNVYHLARREYKFESPASFDTIQTSNAVSLQIYRVGEAKSRKERSAPSQAAGSFFGRQREIETLKRQLRSATDGRLVMLKLTGDMGIGKSRLVSHFVQSIDSDTVEVLMAEILFAERDKPLASAAAVVRAVLGLPEGECVQALGDKLNELMTAVPRYQKRQLTFFGDFLSSPDVMWTRYLGGKRELIRRVAHGLGVLLNLMASRRPMVIVIDNAHWIDAPSVDVLSELADIQSSVRAFVLFVGHSNTMTGRRIAGLESIHVAELPEQTIRQLLIELLGNSDSMRVIADQVAARAGGNPFFASEIIDSLIEQNIIVPITEEGRSGYRQAKPGTIRLPATMEGIAASQVDKLTSDQRSVLRTASAVGASFPIKTVSKLFGRDVSTEVKALTHEGLLVQNPGESQGTETFRFRQPMVREAAYKGLSEPDQNRIHLTMADTLIKAASDGEPIPPVRIAWHLDRSGQGAKAGQYYLAAGDAAMEIYSSREGLRLYERAIRRLDKGTLEHFDALARHERVLSDLARFDERHKEIARMRKMSRLLDDFGLMAYTAGRRAQLLYDLGEFADAARMIGRALKYALSSHDSITQVEAMRLLSYVAVEGGHLISALDCIERALSVVPDAHELTKYLRGRVLGVKGFVLQQMGHVDRAAVPLAEALFLFHSKDKRRDESQVLSNLSLLAQSRGEISVAIEFMERAMRIDNQIRDISAKGRKQAVLGTIELEIGNFHEAEIILTQSRATCRENRELIGEAEAELGLADLLLNDGNNTQAKELLEQIARRGFINRSRLLVVRHRQLAATSLMNEGMYTAAATLVEEAMKIAMEAGMNAHIVHIGCLQGLIMANASRPGEAQSVTRRASDLLTTLKVVHRGEYAWWLQAQTFKKIGNDYRANAALKKARKEIVRKLNLITNQSQKKSYENHPLIKAIETGFCEP